MTALLLAVLWHAPQVKTIHLLIEGRASDTVLQGLELGVAEAEQTARLLGATVALVKETTPDLAGTIVPAAANPPRLSGRVPTLHLAPLPAGADTCSFTVAPVDDAGAAWHASLNRYGASELNERFLKRFRRGMDADAYRAWIAVKGLVEAALRRRANEDPCAAVARLRFDGHKGRPLSFDPQTRILRQPTYIVQNGKVVGEKE
jgi:hypothetical protein